MVLPLVLTIALMGGHFFLFCGLRPFGCHRTHPCNASYRLPMCHRHRNTHGRIVFLNALGALGVIVRNRGVLPLLGAESVVVFENRNGDGRTVWGSFRRRIFIVTGPSGDWIVGLAFKPSNRPGIDGSDGRGVSRDSRRV